MLKSEAMAIIDEATALWPNWKPTETQADFWGDHVATFGDAAVVRKAMRRHRTATHWREPHFDEVEAELNRVAAPNEAQPEGPKACGVYVQCRSHPNKPGQVGRFVPMIYPNGTPAPDRLAKIAEELAFRHASMYGGEWVVVQGATDRDMVIARGKLRKALRLPRQYVGPGIGRTQSIGRSVMEAIADFMKSRGMTDSTAGQ